MSLQKIRPRRKAGARVVADVIMQTAGTMNQFNEAAPDPQYRFRSVRGRLLALQGKELEVAQQTHATVTHEFITRRPGILPTDELHLTGGEVLQVEASVPLGDRQRDFRLLVWEKS